MTSGGSGRGQIATAVAVALAIMSGVGVSSAEAAGLGRLTVQSALGQPLRAEVEVTAVAPDEADSLTARLASPDAFRQAGLQYKEALSGVRMAVEKRDGRYFVKLSSNRPINEPFVDLMLELSWGSGNFTREYTFLLDPPVQRNASQQSRSGAAPVAGASVGGAPLVQQGNGSVRTIDPATGRLVSQDRGQARQPVTSARPAAEQPTTATAGQQAGTVVVGKGETLGMIAARVRPDSATLEQTIVAIHRNNPAAFIQNNPHLIRQGRTLNIPSESEIASIDAGDASRQLRMAARDFRSYKERLAAGVVDLGTGGGSTTASGTVTAPAGEDRTADAQKTDRLELSRSDASVDGKGSAVGARDAEAQVAREAALKEANSRIAELEKNVGALRNMLELKDKSLAELQKQLDKARAAGAAVSGAVAPAATAAAEKAAADRLAAEKAEVEKLNAQKLAAEQRAAAERAALEKVQADKHAAEEAARKAEADKAAADKAAADRLAAADAEAGKVAAEADKAAADKAESMKDDAVRAADDAKAAAEKAAADAKAEVAKVTDTKPMPAPASVNEGEEQGNVIDNITQNPLLLPGLGAFAVVAGLGYWMLRRRRREEDAFSDSLGADEFTANSLFGTTGGQSVDTMTGGTSTQITTISESTPTEVDPIAEAEVYIAYGRETQAEEILREALKRQPERQAIRLKLLEIFAGRKDTVAFSQMAREMHEMTGGLNEEWPRVVAMGAALDPDNPLYGEAQANEAPVARHDAVPGDQGVAAGMAAAGMVAAAAASVSSTESPAVARAPEVPQPAPVAEDNGLDFDPGIEQSLADLDQPAAEAPAPQTFQATRSGPLSAMPGVELPSLDLDAPLDMDEGPATVTDLNVDTTITESLNMDMEPPAGHADLEAIGLDLSPSTISGPVTMSGAASSQWQEMASKLDLASAYTEIGDKDGARELLEEVLNGGDATQQQRARELLADL